MYRLFEGFQKINKLGDRSYVMLDLSAVSNIWQSVNGYYWIRGEGGQIREFIYSAGLNI